MWSTTNSLVVSFTQIFVWLMGIRHQVSLRCIMMVNGDQYVMITGLALMLTLPVNTLDSYLLVSVLQCG